MREPYIDPMVAVMAMMAMFTQPKRKPIPPTPEQIERRKKEAEHDEWNAQVAARKAAKKGSK